MALDSSRVTRRNILVAILIAAWLGFLTYMFGTWNGQFRSWLIAAVILLAGYAGIRFLARDLK